MVIGHSERQKAAPAVMPTQAGVQAVGARRRGVRLDSPVEPENDEDEALFVVVIVVVIGPWRSLQPIDYDYDNRFAALH